MVCKLVSRPKCDYTTRRLFFFMLHQARRLKYDLGMSRKDRWGYLLGIKCALTFLYDDYRIADNMRDYWKQS